MKAVILAAGKGSRLGTLSNEIPKPMIKYNGKPLVEHNILLCKKYGIKEIFINTHHLANVITSYLGNGDKFGVKINYSYENKLLGTAGALNNFREYLSSEPFFVLYGDNVSNFPLEKIIDKFNTTNSIGVIAFHFREDVSQSGVAEFDEHDKIIKFVEKPKEGETESKWVNAGIYFLSPKVLDFIPIGFSDFAKDIFPKLLRNQIPLYGVKQKEIVRAFDTPEMLAKSLRGIQ